MTKYFYIQYHLQDGDVSYSIKADNVVEALTLANANFINNDIIKDKLLVNICITELHTTEFTSNKVRIYLDDYVEQDM